ncbi:hypothetical protein ACKI16_43405 [Streptomyces scabiei]
MPAQAVCLASTRGAATRETALTWGMCLDGSAKAMTGRRPNA